MSSTPYVVSKSVPVLGALLTLLRGHETGMMPWDNDVDFVLVFPGGALEDGQRHEAIAACATAACLAEEGYLVEDGAADAIVGARASDFDLRVRFFGSTEALFSQVQVEQLLLSQRSRKQPAERRGGCWVLLFSKLLKQGIPGAEFLVLNAFKVSNPKVPKLHRIPQSHA